MRRIEIDMEEVKLVPKAQRKYDDAEMAALLKRIADEVEESNREMERILNRPLVVPEIMRDPQAAVNAMKNWERSFEDPEFVRITEEVNKKYHLFELPDDFDLTITRPVYPEDKQEFLFSFS
mmetsp:Transcript_1097/g.2645  ORF Transcript_1097/g.2645 Transcript_1097/m.2645 type:complete len:122 (-) Transcript_1097:8-373(-)